LIEEAVSVAGMIVPLNDLKNGMKNH